MTNKGIYLSDLGPEHSKCVDLNDYSAKISTNSQKVKQYVKNLLTVKPEFTGLVEIHFIKGNVIKAKHPEETKL